MNICVFLSSSDAVEPHFVDLACRAGSAIAERGHTLVFGGNKTGLMGHLAASARSAGGRIIGIVPRKLNEMGRTFTDCDEQIVTEDLRDRKALMDQRSDAFIALPGGLGTYEEIIEVLNLKYLRYHSKPVIFLNHKGFYDPLFAAFESLYAGRFTKRAIERLYADLPDVESIFPYLERYQPVQVEEKWYDRSTDAI